MGEEQRWSKMADALAAKNTLDYKTVAKYEAELAEMFAQHVVQDLMWEQMQTYYEKARRRVERLRIYELRRVYHVNAYDGLSGAHAWILESYGDCLLEVTGDAITQEDRERA